MALPTARDLVEAIHLYLEGCPDGQATNDQVELAMRNRFKLTDGDLMKRTQSAGRANGESEWRLRLRRAKFDLTKAGIVQSGAGRGLWRIVGR